MRRGMVVLFISLIMCASCGSTHASTASVAATNAPCPPLPSAVSNALRGTTPSQEQSKQLGDNGGGCYNAATSTTATGNHRTGYVSANSDTHEMCVFARATKLESLVDLKSDWTATAAKYPHADPRLLRAAELINRAVISQRELNLDEWNAAPPLISRACGIEANQYGLMSALRKLDSSTTTAP